MIRRIFIFMYFFPLILVIADDTKLISGHRLKRDFYLYSNSDINFFTDSSNDRLINYLMNSPKVTQYYTLPCTRQLEQKLIDYLVNIPITKNNFEQLKMRCDMISSPAIHLKTEKAYEYLLKYRSTIDFGIKNIKSFQKDCNEYGYKFNEWYHDITERIRRNISFWDELKSIACSGHVSMVKVDKGINYKRFNINKIHKIKAIANNVDEDKKRDIKKFLLALYEYGGNHYPDSIFGSFNYVITYDGNVVFLVDCISTVKSVKYLQIVKINVYYDEKGKLIVNTSYKHDPHVGPQVWVIALNTKMSKAWSELLKKLSE